MDATVADPLVGRLVDGRYAVRCRIAVGGMAVVYQAVDTRLDRPVALKAMHPWLAADPELVERFAREAKSAARLSAPGIVPVYDQGRDGDLVWLAMAYVEGRTLRDLLRERGRLEPGEALSVLLPVLEALAAAHRAGLLHRDVKPENVLLADDGGVRVADFGLVRAVTSRSTTRADGVLGSVSYLAPELLERGRADERVDVYAAGTMLFELLTGAPPFAGETPVQVAYQHVHGDVPPPSVRLGAILPRELDALVVHATRRDPAMRPRDAGAMLAEARAVAEALSGPAARTVPVPARPLESTTATPPVVRHERRSPPWALLSAVLALAVVAVALWFGPLRYTAPPTLVGLAAADAQNAARRDGFPVTLTQAFSDTVARGDVAAVSPARPWVRRGSRLRLVVSQGPEMHRVPQVAGLSLADARAALQRNRLQPGAVSNGWSDTVAKGLVATTTPATGVNVRHDTVVALVVSKGPQPVTVPDLVGKSQYDALAALKALRLPADVTTDYSTTVDKGSVIRQGTTAGTTVLPGTHVGLVVSLGPPLVEVPHVVGKRVSTAVAQLEAVGFQVKVRGISVLGLVLFENPGGGSHRPLGSTITLTST